MVISMDIFWCDSSSNDICTTLPTITLLVSSAEISKHLMKPPTPSQKVAQQTAPLAALIH